MLNLPAARQFLLDSDIPIGPANRALDKLGYHGWFKPTVLKQYVYNYHRGSNNLPYMEVDPS